MLLVTFFLNFLGVLFLISAAEKLLAITIFVFLSILGIFDIFVYSSTMNPKIVRNFVLFVRTAGINQIMDQIIGSVLFFVLISLFTVVFTEYLSVEILVVWPLLTLIALFLTLTIDVYSSSPKSMRKFFQILANRNAIDAALSLVLSVLVLNIYFYLVSPAWTWENILFFFIVIFSFHVLAGKIFEKWKTRH
jgi:hypothetical protein